MADTVNPSDTNESWRDKYNVLVAEVDAIASINEITADTNVLNTSAKNTPISLIGGANISTTVSGSVLDVALDVSPSVTDLTSSGTITSNIANIDTSVIDNLTAGINPNDYDFPTAVGSIGEALVVNGSGNLEFGLGGTGATTFEALTDVSVTFATEGQGILLLDGTEGGVASNVITDATFTFDATNDFLKVSKIRIGENISPSSTIPIEINKRFEGGTSPSTMFTNTVQYDTATTPSSTSLTNFNNQSIIIDTSVSLVSLNGMFNAIQSSADTTDIKGSVDRAILTSSATATNVMGSEILANVTSSATTTNLFGLYVNVLHNTNVTTSYGIYIDQDVNPIDYGIYSEAGIKTEEFVTYEETANTPVPSLTESVTYFKDKKHIIAHDDAGTIRYKYLDMTGTGVTWVHTTVAP